MTRIGIFIDALQGSIPASFRETIGAAAKRLPDVVFSMEEESLTSPDGHKKMSEKIREENLDRAVIVGGSPKLYETSFLKSGVPLPINPYLFAVANVREQALWSMIDETAALEKAKRIMARAVRMVSASRPIEQQSIPLKRDALVLGGGIVGISVAQTLARAGIRVTVVEKGKCLGGNAIELRRFYGRDEDVPRWMEEKISDLHQMPNVAVITEGELKSVSGHVGRFQVKIRCRDGVEPLLSPSAIVVATGMATRSERKGIYSHKGAITLSAMERLLSETPGSALLWDGKTVKTVAFLLDGINEDIKVDSINAVKQALLLQENHRCQVAVLCKDVKVSADGMERLYRKAREKGVLFFKYDTPPGLSVADNRIQVHVKDTAAIRKEDQWPVSIPADLLVTGEAFIPNPETERICSLLKLHLGDRGFLMEDNPQLLRVRSNRRGIFLAGGCRFPQEISESLIEARAAAQEVITLFAQGAYTFDLAVAEVDPKKCAVCYTCPRLCPHSAITVEKYAERNVYTTSAGGGEVMWGAAKVDPAACHGCGICVAECPAKAITFRHQTDEQIYIQMAANESK